MAKNIEFDILARDRASKTFDHVGKASDGLGSKLGGLAKGGLLGVAGAAGVAAAGGIAALGVALFQGVKDAADYQTLAKKTAAVLKSTGNAAHQSVKGIQDRAGALESMSGVDETTIINGQNVLATFTKVQDRVGKGNDIFSRATAAALDMSTALGTDMQGSVIQLGKALNDPIKGVTALSRVGVSFTAQQKKQIRTLVDSGKTMEAQKLILKELNTEFGGAAKAAGQGFNGAWARAKDSIQDAFRAIGMKLLPTLTKVGDYIAEHGGPLIEGLTRKLGSIWAKIKPGLSALADWFFNKGLPAIRAFGGWISGKLWPALQKGYQTILPGVRQALGILSGGVEGNSVSWKKIGDIITTKVIPVLATIIRVWLPQVAMNWRTIIEVVKKVWAVLGTLVSIWKSSFTVMLRMIAAVMTVWAGMLRALSHIPGFGWAKDAANKLAGAAAQANALASAINRIPTKKTVTVNTYFKTHGNPNPLAAVGSGAGVKGYAKGGTNLPRGWKIVGEDGPELMYTPGGDTVIPSRESKRILSGGSAGAGAGGDTYVFNISGIVGNEQAVVDKIHTLLLAKQRRSGTALGLA